MKKKNFLFRSKLHFRLAMLIKLPSVFFWGIRLDEITHEKCIVSIPYRWTTQNPFKSIYFSALAGAAELSTGLLILDILGERKDVSMLVVSSKLEFFIKAKEKIVFICEEGEEISKVIRLLKSSGDTGSYSMTANGFNSNKELVARMVLEWSFKKR